MVEEFLISQSSKKLQLLASELCVFVSEVVDGSVVVVGDGHHRFYNFDLRSSDMDGECRKVVVFSHLKGFY